MTYSSVTAHHAMVFDNVRNPVYVAALKQIVTPESVVLDLGAGTGILGLAAAAAGAKRVYLVEPEPVVKVAQEFARANGIADRIVIIEDRIEDIRLPESVDVIISVFAGNILFSEDLLPSLFHARDHYLKPGGYLVPDIAELVVAPVSAPDVHRKNIACWSQPNLGLNLSAGRRFAPNSILWPRREDLQVNHLGPDTILSRLDLASCISAACQSEAHCLILTSGVCHGFLGWIQIRLGEEWLSTDPRGPETHWSTGFFPIDPPLELNAGETIRVALQRPVGGDWTWTIEASSGSRRHSSFLSRTDGPDRLRKLAPEYCPGLDERGQATLQALQWMLSGHCNQDIAQNLANSYPRIFHDVENALQRVQHLALRYGTKAQTSKSVAPD